MKAGAQLDLFQQLRPVEVGPADSPGSIVRPGAVESIHATPPPPKPPVGATAADDVVLESGTVRVWYIPHRSARRYRLMLRVDGTARCTIPGRGSLREARRFVDGARSWLDRQWQRRSQRPAVDTAWRLGTMVWFRGQKLPLQRAAGPGILHFKLGAEELPLQRVAAQGVPSDTSTPDSEDHRSSVEQALRRLAVRELPKRVQELAAVAAIPVSTVSVRNQRTRWGSCSRRGTISLNWRLVQTPEFVRDYIILHELAHQRHLDHSERFWAEVARLCPEWELAEAWIKLHGRELI